MLNANTAMQNGDDGIEIGGQKNKVVNGASSDNVEGGIDFTDTKNLVRGGTMQGNGAFDVNDCAGNKLKNVTFSTASPDCPGPLGR